MSSTFTLIDRGYVRSVIRSMTRNGFLLMAWITPNSNELKYFQEVEYAQHDRLFFSLPGKTMLVMLELTQYQRPGREPTVYWSGSVEVSWNGRQDYKDYLDSIKETSEFWNHEPAEYGYSPTLALDHPDSPWHTGWGDCSEFSQMWSFDQKDSNTLLSPELLTAVFPQIVLEIGKYMYPRFHDLQVTDYPPHQTFPGCEQWFWKRFPLKALLTKVSGSVWGGGVPNNRR